MTDPLYQGWLGPLKGIMFQALTFLKDMTGNYGIAIILLTLAIRVLILPLTVKQMKSMKKMQEIQGPMKELQEKYKDQPEKLREEMAELYRKHGTNPMSGCWPTLVQLPFFWALFQMLEIKQPEFAGTTFLGLNLAQPSLILGITVAVVTLVQNYFGGMAGMQPGGAVGGAQQKVLMYGMPVLFGYFATRFPAGVALYYVASTVFGFVQQAIYPGFGKRRTDNMAPKGAAAVEAVGEKRQNDRGSGKPRSARTGRKS